MLLTFSNEHSLFQVFHFLTCIKYFQTKLTKTNGMEADANYEQVTMDMSEVWISKTLIYSG